MKVCDNPGENCQALLSSYSNTWKAVGLLSVSNAPELCVCCITENLWCGHALLCAQTSTECETTDPGSIIFRGLGREAFHYFASDFSSVDQVTLQNKSACKTWRSFGLMR